jgi:hypothetical protein
MTQWNEQLGWHRGEQTRCARLRSISSLRGHARQRGMKDGSSVIVPSGPPG